MEGLVYLTISIVFLVALCASCRWKRRDLNAVETVIGPDSHLIQEVSYQPNSSSSNGHLNLLSFHNHSPLVNHHNHSPIVNRAREPIPEPTYSQVNRFRDPNDRLVETPIEPTYAEPIEPNRVNNCVPEPSYSVVANHSAAEPVYSVVSRRPRDIVLPDNASLTPSEPGSDGGESVSEGRTISYNKISVREPLARVLAERAVMEHTYTEVDGEEALSSFYEEIAPSIRSGQVSVVGPSVPRPNIEDPGYEVVANDYDEPGYEEIGRRNENGYHTYERPDNVYSDGSIADPGYEVVGPYPDSDADPGYEIIKKK